MKLLITGGFGLVGSRLIELWGNKYEILVLDQNDESHQYPNISFKKVDITQKIEVEKAVSEYQPDWIVHLAAFTDVEKAESLREAAWNLNVEATVFLAEAAKKQGSSFIYLSTGFVFDGNQDTFDETDPEKPVNYYGLTKTEGERALKKLDLPISIIRINFPYRTKWEKKSDTIRWMVPKLINQEKLTLVTDQYVSPTFIDDIAPLIDKIIEKNSTGVYHLASPECLSFYQIGELLTEIMGVNKDLLEGTTLDEFLTKSGRIAVQPKHSCLVSQKLEIDLNIKPTSLKEGLKKVVESYQ